MKLWISGQIEAEIGDDFRHTMNEVERLVNDKILKIDYGNGLAEWDIIFVILEKETKDSFKYDKRTASTDIRLNLNFLTFKSLDGLGKKRMFIDHLMKSLDVLRDKGVKGVNWDKLKADLSSIDLVN